MMFEDKTTEEKEDRVILRICEHMEKYDMKNILILYSHCWLSHLNKDNDNIELEADLILDFSETNPFGTP